MQLRPHAGALVSWWYVCVYIHCIAELKALHTDAGLVRCADDWHMQNAEYAALI